MPRVICDLPNAALEINGVPFEKMEDGRIRSAEVEQEIADFFLSIPGYLADGVPVIDKTTVASTAPKAAKAAKAAKAPVVDPAIAIAAAAAAEAEAATRAAEAEAEANAAAEAEAAAADAEAAAATAAGETGNAGATGDAPPADDVF